MKLVLGNKTSDPMSGFFIFKKKIFLKYRRKMYIKGYKILADLIYSSDKNLKIQDVTIKFNRRILGRSKMNLSILIKLLFFIMIKSFKKIVK